MNKKDAIRQLIEQQNAFMKDVNENGYEEENYWLNMSEYRKNQENLAKHTKHIGTNIKILLE
jgi:plasmid replication initiation protein